MRLLSVSEAADEIGCRPRDISDAFYRRDLDESRVMRIAGRRVIPLDYLAEIRDVLAGQGKAEAV